MLHNNTHLTELQAPEQTIRARVELYNGSTLEKICNCGDILEEFAVEKTGEGKYFGFGICQKLATTLIDLQGAIDLNSIDSIEASFGVNSNFIYPFPKFYLQEAERDEVFGVVRITAYDALYKAAAHTMAEIKLILPCTLKNYASAIATVLGLPLVIDDAANDSFELIFETPANFDGTETLRAALDAIAEATQTIYYIDNNWALRFKRLDAASTAALTIDKNKYVELSDEGARTITNVAFVTELGNNVSTTSSTEGDTQYIRDNPFWELRTDVDTLINNALSVVDGLSINQFRCDWSGNYLLEIGDKISIVKDDGTVLTTYILDDNITFDGSLWQINGWSYSGNEAESATNPTSLGEVINTTYARVDKISKQIDLVASEVSDNASAISTLQITTNGISASVSSVEKNINKKISEIDDDIETLTKSVNTKITADDLTIEISKVKSEGANKVETSTGFTFNEEGLTVSKSGSEMSTQITEDGMVISRSGQETLVADNTGVKAENLHATTYLIIGVTSRFEDYNGNRTGCFWIGG